MGRNNWKGKGILFHAHTKKNLCEKSHYGLASTKSIGKEMVNISWCGGKEATERSQGGGGNGGNLYLSGGCV